MMIRTIEIPTVRDLIDRMADTSSDHVFLVSPDTGRSLTFRELQQGAIRLYGRLRKMGLVQGDKIALLMDNGLLTVQLFLGAMYGGFLSVPLNVRAGKSQLCYMLDHCDAKAIFVGDNYKSLLSEAAADISRPLEVVSANSDEILADSDAPFDGASLPPVNPEDAALLMYSSGTTGRPNGAIHTHRSLVAHGRNAAQSHQLTSADRSLLVLPIYHINAECVTLLPTLTSGGSVVVPHGFVVSEFWDWLCNHGCTWSALVPTIVSQLLDWNDPKVESRASAFRRIRFLRTSSGPLSPSLHREFLEKYKLLLIQAMGCSEGGNVFSNPLPPGKNKVGSPGFPWGFEARIVDRDGVDVSEGEPGEVLLRGDGLMQGYFKDLASTAAAFDRDGWFHTGDLAYRDQDGYFFVVGRSKELVIKGGMNIAPKQVDEVLESHPAVLEAAAVGVPDRHLGEDLVAFAVLRDGLACSEGDLLSFCDEHLGHFKTPTRIHFVSDLPKGPSGKVQRLRLVNEGQRLTTANSVLSANVSVDPSTSKPSHRPAVTDSLLEQAIGEIWSDLLSEPEIDPSSNFFALGGQSLVAIKYLSRLRDKVQVILSLSDFFENPTVRQQAELVRKRLAESEEAAAAISQTESQSVEPRDRSAPCRLSPGQGRLWFLDQLISGEPAYNESEAVRLKGNLKIELLERAFNFVIERREVLRSTIEVRNGQPQVVVHDKWPIKFNWIDLSELPVDQREAKLERLLVVEPRRRYRLEAEPGIRLTVVKLTEEEHAFILMMHHIICDSASVGILWREVVSAYQAYLAGRSPSLTPLPIQYWDYAAWQRLPSQQAAFEADLAFWRENLREAPQVLELPTDRPRPSANSFRGEKRQFALDSELATKLRSLSRQEQTSLFTAFAAALNVLFHRYTGKDDVLVGIPIANRDRPELQSLIGFMLDTHVLRTDLSGNPSFRELMARVQRGVVDVYSHRSVPFDQVVNAFRPERNVAYSPLFQVLLNWRDRDEQPQFIGFPGLVVEPLLTHSKTSKFDITFVVTETDDDIIVELEYSTDLYYQSSIERMFEHLRMLLEGAVANCEQRIDELPLLTDDERNRLLVEWNSTHIGLLEAGNSIHGLFERQVERTPDAIAVVFERGKLTYRELNRRAEELADRLRILGVGPDVLVALFLERSLDMVVGMLGVLKAGGAYVPLDPTHPSERLAYILADAQPLVLLTQERLRSKLPPYCTRVVEIDASVLPAAWLEHEPAPGWAGSPNNLAYVIYTSGSTGKPKGVEIEHRSVVNMLASTQRRPGLGAKDTMLAITTVTFDIAVLEIFLPLSCGACVVIAASEAVSDGLALADLVEQSGASVLQATPSTLRMLLDAGWGGAPSLKILCGGEAWTAELANQLLGRCASLWNMYGPTETTVWSAVTRVEAGRPIAIGPPIANTRIHILDRYLQLVPIGVPGELHIGGAGLARRYHNRAELTAEKFIPDPFGMEPGARLYKTGDLARYLPDGAIEYLGRLDDQVKIRGFRIELGEIESVLAALPGVREAVVQAREDVPGDKRLVAYLTIKEGQAPKVSELRHQLQAKLPNYMIPSALVPLEKFPLTPNGKVDRKALPVPEKKNVDVEGRYIAPTTHLERVLCQIWCKRLNLEPVGTRDNFFELGGYSVLAAHVVGDINATLAKNLSILAFFRNQTIEQLAAFLERQDHDQSRSQILPVHSGGLGLPLYIIGMDLPEHRVAQLIGENRTVFGVDVSLSAEWSDAITTGARSAIPTFEQLGALYGNALHGHVGSSPCVVVGCYGRGKLAFEAAHVLQRAGGNIALVLLIDAFAGIGGNREVLWQSLRSIWRTATDPANDTPHIKRLSTLFGNLWRWLWWLVPRMLGVVKGRVVQMISPLDRSASLIDKQGKPVTPEVLRRFSRNAIRSFHPRPLDVPGALIRAEYAGEHRLPGHDISNGWLHLFVQGLEIIQAKGDHVTIVSDENAAAFGRQVNALLDRYPRNPSVDRGHWRLQSTLEVHQA